MIIRNGAVFYDDGIFRPADLAFHDGVITRITESGTLSDDEILDVSGAFVVPGYVDIHIHGAMGSDFCDGTEKAVRSIAAYLGKQGITSFLGTTMALGEDELIRIISAVSPFVDQPLWGSTCRGIHLEGPFFSKTRKGAQNEKYFIKPDLDLFDRLFAASYGCIRLLDLAPELVGSMALISHAAKKCTVSLAHTDADYDTAAAAFRAGATHVTHLFNAMPPFNHRSPGVIGAAGDFAGHVELICDGIHIHPSVIRNVFKWFGPERVCLISDATGACGITENRCTLGGQPVLLSDGRALLTDGTLAGSITDLAECVRRAVNFGIPLASALQAATCNPARAVGLDAIIGSLTPGKSADIQILDERLMPQHVFVKGQEIRDRDCVI